MKKAVIKAAKKVLKKEGDLKLGDLSAKIAKKLQTADVEQVKGEIEKSSKLVISNHVVSLKRKRNNGDSDSSDKSTKKAKKDTTLADDASVTTDIDRWRKEHKIVIMHSHDDEEGKKMTEKLNKIESYFPFQTFDTPLCKTSIHPALLKQCTEGNGFTKPSPIQAQAWPILTQDVQGRKRDVVGIAETGSGKTLAFALPALSTLVNDKKSKRKKPRMLVLAPTRELAMQSDEVLREFGAVVGLKSLVVYGGVPKHVQIGELKRGIDCLVATPGRLKDLMQDGSCDLSDVEYLVLDEADRMLDMGFEEEVRRIVEQCKAKEAGRQTAMFSATWPAAIQKIAMDYMVDPVRVYVGFESLVGSNDGTGMVDDSLSANKRVTQTVEVIEDRQRESRLRQILQKVHKKRDNRVLVFALYKKEAERLEQSLQRDGWNCCSIHGNKTQQARTAALAEFKDGTCPLLIATDVAARGLDIPNVEVVINFTFPLTIEDYVHRIGRTGRAGQTGVSYTFFQQGDKSHAGELQQVMKQAGQTVPESLMKFGSTIKKKEHKVSSNDQDVVSVEREYFLTKFVCLFMLALR